MPTGDTAHDEPRQAATGRDTRYSLTIEDASDLYARAGHPRTYRTIQRYCASGHLDSIKVATALGDKYFIDPTSLSRHVAQIEEMARLDLHATGRDTPRPVATTVAQDLTDDMPRHQAATEPDMSSPVAPTVSESTVGSGSDGGVRQVPTGGDEPRPAATVQQSMSSPVAQEQNDVSRYVVGLEREVERLLDDREFAREQIRTKDKQIEALLERDRETNILVRGLQQMLSPLLGVPRPRDTHDPRSGGGSIQ